MNLTYQIGGSISAYWRIVERLLGRELITSLHLTKLNTERTLVRYMPLPYNYNSIHKYKIHASYNVYLGITVVRCVVNKPSTRKPSQLHYTILLQVIAQIRSHCKIE